MTGTLPTAGPWRRWLHLARYAMVVVVSMASLGIVAIVVQNARLVGEMTLVVSDAQERASNLSNAQREALRLLQEVTELSAGGDVETVAVRRGLLARQLLVSIAVFPSSSTEAEELRSVNASIKQFSWSQLRGPRAETVQAAAKELVSKSEIRIEALYSAQEKSFYQATLQSLERKRNSQNSLAWLVGLVSALGLCWVVVLTRSKRTSVARAYTALRTSESRFRSLVQRASDLTVVTDAAGTVTYASPSVETILGLSPDELVGDGMLDYIDGRDRQAVADVLAGLVADPTALSAVEFRVTSTEGRLRTVEALCRNLSADESVGGIVWNGRDVTDRRVLQDQLSHQAFHDALTGLPNRALFLRRLEEAIRDAERSGGSLSAVLIDLDGFKNVNHTLGHAAGDELLQHVSERLRGCVKKSDVVARLGGDEFAMVLATPGPSEAMSVSQRVIEAMRRSLRVARQDVHVGMSIGIAHLDRHRTAEELLSDADIAMYAAKNAGKGRFEVFTPQMRQTTEQRTRTEQLLTRAVELDEIEVHYQPIVDLGTDEVTLVEALARWRHPDGRLMPPSTFIPIAEETGLIVDLGRDVLMQACRAVQEWRDTVAGCSGLGVSVNVSGIQLVSGHLSTHVLHALSDSGLPAEHLVLEITESTLLENSDVVLDELSKIKALGVKLAMDDFGAGYSSLASLLRFRFPLLKIDRSSLDVETTGDRSLVQAIAELGGALRLRVVAEGVETAQQLARVRAAGCDAAQGFFLARPMTLDDTGLFLRDARTSGPASPRQRVRVLPVPAA